MLVISQVGENHINDPFIHSRVRVIIFFFVDWQKMYWDTGYNPSPMVDSMLSKEDLTLRELLEDEDILQECKTQNQKLIKL